MKRAESSRRDFLKQAGLLSTAIVLAPGCMAEGQSKSPYKLGLQLFSINDAMNADPLGTLQKVKDMGYQDFEIYGFAPEKLTYYGIEAHELKQRLDDMGLSISSGHYGLADYRDDTDAMKRYVDQCIKGAKVLDAAYITWPWHPPKDRNLERFKALPEVLNRIGEQVNAAGLGFAYHNHGFEFVDYDGTNGYEIVMAEADPELVKLQLDMYWSEHSIPGITVDLIARDPERFVMWHIKDMDKITRDYTEMGNGSIDYHDILSRASQEGLQYYYIEQGGNFAVNSVQSAATSAKYFQKELKEYIEG